MIRSYRSLGDSKSIKDLFVLVNRVSFSSRYGIGIALLQFTAFGLFSGGITIMIVGMTSVFVPQDLSYMGLTPSDLASISDRLVPLIAHDRASFGGGVATIGLLFFFSIRRAMPSRNLWEILILSLGIGFAAAVAVHWLIGYTDYTHLAPAYLGILAYLAGLILTYNKMVRRIDD